MLSVLHTALRTLLHNQGQISPDEVDVRFEAPTRDFIERLTRPTIDLFLYGVGENTDLRRTDFPATRENGRAQRRMPPRRIDLRYLVCALATDADDEHRLLWRALLTLMKFPEFPAEALPEELRQLEPPLTTRTAQPDEGSRLLDVWSALSVEPHSAFAYVVTAPLDLELAIEAPLVLTRTVRSTRAEHGHAAGGVAPESGLRIGGVVRNKAGTPLAGVTVAMEGRAAPAAITDADGRFALSSLPPGRVALRLSRASGTSRTVRLEVPAASYDLTLD